MPEMCNHCNNGPTEANPVARVEPSKAENPHICRRCLIRAALAVDPKGEHIIVRVPAKEDAKFYDVFDARGNDTIGSMMDAIAAWTNRARDETTIELRTLIARLRSSIGAAGAQIESLLRDAADLGIDLNAPKTDPFDVDGPTSGPDAPIEEFGGEP